MTGKIKILIILCCLLLSSSFGSRVEIKEVRSTGQGSKLREAIDNALVRAVKQVNGVTVSSNAEAVICSSDIFVSSDNNESFLNTNMEDYRKTIRTSTDGHVAGFDIISQNNDSGIYEVEIMARIPVFVHDGTNPHLRKKIIVLPFRTDRTCFELNGDKVSSSKVVDTLAAKLVSEITHTRRFSVLDRKFTREYIDEKEMILMGDVIPVDKEKLNQVLSTGYILTGEISEFMYTYTKEYNEWTKATIEKHYVSACCDYSIIDFATRQVKWAGSLNLELNENDLEYSNYSNFTIVSLLNYITEKMADEITIDSIESIFPPRVIDVTQDGRVVLNIGGRAVDNGDVYDVYSAGKEYFDPYTGESLGKSEKWIAKIMIINNTSKMSYANVIEGNLKDLTVGDICRRSKDIPDDFSSSSDIIGHQPTVEILPGGGVVLPGD